MKSSYIPGPTYDEMRDPASLPAPLLKAARKALRDDELNPLNLFNIHWRRDDGKTPRFFVLPPALTGVPCNIVVLEGAGYPSGSHKVGPAYATLAEHEADGLVDKSMTIIGPSTGNFGIGTAYVSNLKGYNATVVMPDSMSAERYDRIKKYGGSLDLTPGCESDVILVLERVHHQLMKDPKNHVLAQFELLPNYRFHRHVTGSAAVDAVKGLGDGRVAAFSWAAGSAGTLAAGDHLKKLYPDVQVSCVEPVECATLTNGGRGEHRIEGIGDKMCVLIHNVLTTDWISTIHDDDCVKGLYALTRRRAVLGKKLKVDEKTLDSLETLFGVSGVCHILAAIKLAKKLGLRAGENLVTAATDGFDRYPSVMTDLERRMGGSISDKQVGEWIEGIFLDADDSGFTDVRPADQKQRLFKQKEEDWLKFGYSQKYLDGMRSQDFWEAEYEKVHLYNERIASTRAANGGLPSGA